MKKTNIINTFNQLVVMFTLIFALATVAAAQVVEPSPIAESSATARVFQMPDLSTPEAYLQYLRANSQNVAAANFSLLPNGNIDWRDPVILHNAETKMPLASLVKVIHLAAYAKAVTEGQLNPHQLVPVGELDNLYLPGTDGFAHLAALQDLGIATDEFGFARNPATTITLEQMVRAMIRFSDNTVPDWLLARLGDGAFREVIRQGGLTGQDLPIFIAGFNLALENHEQGLLSAQSEREFLNLSPFAFARLVKQLQVRFQDPAWKSAEFTWRLANQDLLGNRTFLTKTFVRWPNGTVLDYAMLLARLSQGTFLSREISATMRRFLETSLLPSLLDDPNQFSVWGSKGGSWDGGFQTNAIYAIPRSGAFANKRRIAVLFERNMALPVFDEVSRTFIDIKFEAKVLADRAFAMQLLR